MAKPSARTKPMPPEPSWFDASPEEYRDVLARHGMSPRSDQRAVGFNNMVIFFFLQGLDEVSFRRYIAYAYLDAFGAPDEPVYDDGL